MVVEYLGSDKDLINLLLLNRECYSAIKRTVWKQVLLISSPERLIKKRNQLWLNILGINSIQVDYQSLKQKVYQQPDLIKKVEEVIELDVQRSEH